MAVDLALAKQHLRVDHSDEDALIAQYLAAAIAWVENYTSKKLTRGAVTQELDCFTRYLPLYWGPNPASLTVTYLDTDDAEQAVTNATIVGSRAFADWPTKQENTPITLDYTAGYTDVPADLDSAVLLLVGEFYDNREAGEASPAVSMAVEGLCRPYRSLRL